MHKNLELALRKNGFSKKDYARFLDIAEKTVHNKIAGVTDFTYPEVEKTVKLLFHGKYDVWHLFHKEQTPA